ncbi:hypothetical protein [Roseobacter sinensis]|uniref:Uncharacterized protein n=1 Tax=Roseobacter sinensis TaxID=2931391 RepID=A0ABT3BKQ5_9RHOB|nr:hypothetical protein [Roseobacter sp. WL0113]MCV3274162.1 hypothetical protein [Roseobacter sp. WL0113]
MLTRSTRSTVTFSNEFTIGDSQRELPAGTYEVVIEEELLQGLSFEAYRRTVTYLMVLGRGRNAGQTTMQMTTKEDLEHAIACDRAVSETTSNSEAALSPLEDTT